MARLPGGFNSEEHDDMGFTPLPKGDYLMEIVESDYKENSKKNGHYLQLVREVIEGEYKGRKFYSNLNLDNPNTTARELAGKEFAQTCRACGVVNVEDSEELHNIPHMVSLAIKKGDQNNPDQNRVIDIQPAKGLAAPPKKGESAKPSGKPARKRPVFDKEEEEQNGSVEIEDED